MDAVVFSVYFNDYFQKIPSYALSLYETAIHLEGWLRSEESDLIGFEMLNASTDTHIDGHPYTKLSLCGVSQNKEIQF